MSFVLRNMLQSIVKTGRLTVIEPSGASSKFGDGTGEPIVLKINDYKTVLKLALDPDISMGIYFPSGVNWAQVQRGLAALKTPEARVKEVKRILESHPDDPMGRSLLIYALVELRETEEAMAVASRLRRDGLAGPSVLAVLCDLQAEAGMVPEARRTCSELVEFNSDDPGARQRLGDLFLRQAWYADAYRQYKTLVEVFSDTPGALLRLAAAAAGMGKVDEALRIERKVASGDGEPGPMDPRRWARLHSAARLAGMILDAKASNDKDNIKALSRNLKRTQVFGSSASIVVLVWEDLHVRLDLEAMREDEVFPVSERISADNVGLQMMDLGRKAPLDVEISVKLKGAPLQRAVQFKLFTITWDGKKFTIDRQISQIEPGETAPVDAESV
jgi:Ca-activated chloride channel family protein